MRHRNHKKSFVHEKYSTDTELSKFIWVLKSGNIEYTIKWKILEQAKPFSPVSNTCQLCTREKYYLIFKPDLCTLNERNELGSHCRHKKRLLHSSLWLIQPKKKIIPLLSTGLCPWSASQCPAIVFSVDVWLLRIALLCMKHLCTINTTHLYYFHYIYIYIYIYIFIYIYIVEVIQVCCVYCTQVFHAQ